MRYLYPGHENFEDAMRAAVREARRTRRDHAVVHSPRDAEFLLRAYLAVPLCALSFEAFGRHNGGTIQAKELGRAEYHADTDTKVRAMDFRYHAEENPGAQKRRTDLEV